MALGMRLVPSLRLELRCRVCGQNIDDAVVAATRAAVALFGAEPLAACPSCEQAVPDREESGYVRRARQYISTQGGGS